MKRIALKGSIDFPFDTFVFCLNKDNEIELEGDLVYYNSICRMESGFLIPFDKQEYRTKRQWMRQTFPCSSDMAIIEVGYSYFSSDDVYGAYQLFLDRISSRIQEIIFAISYKNYLQANVTNIISSHKISIFIYNEDTLENIYEFEVTKNDCIPNTAMTLFSFRRDRLKKSSHTFIFSNSLKILKFS